MSQVTAGNREVEGGAKAIEGLAETARGEIAANNYQRASLLSSLGLAQLERWHSGPGVDLRARPSVWIANNAGHLRELEGYLRLSRADAELREGNTAEAESDLARFMKIAQARPAKQAVANLTPYALELLMKAKRIQQDWDQVVTTARVQIERCREASDLVHLSRALAFLAEAEFLLGHITEAKSTITEAELTADKVKDIALSAQVHEIRGRILGTPSR